MQIQKANMDKENDLFSEIVKDKLASYTLPVDEESWEKIAERLNQTSRKRMQRGWIAVIAVAASIALLFLLFPIDKKTYYHETTSQLSNHETTIVQDVSEEEIVYPILQQSVEGLPVFKKSQPRKRMAETKHTAEITFNEAFAEKQPVSPEEESIIAEKQPVSSDFYLNFGKETPIPAIKRKKRQSIRFSFGSGSNFLAENNTQNLNNPSLESGYYRVTHELNSTRTEDILAYEAYSNVNTHLPLSFGVTVKKELNRRFGIESGLVYSFLATTFSKDFPFKSEADRQLHYIGIPLNVHTRIFGDRFSLWEVYLSTGGMVEKGILSHFVQKTYYDTGDDRVMTVNSNEKINGLQWSLSISPGVDYQIHKNYSIYLEPKLNYYFNNDQPVSARTEHPVVVGINAGVRYSW